VVVRKRGKKWEYDFRLLGKRERDGGFATKPIAVLAEKRKQEELLGGKRMTYAEAWEKFLAGTRHEVLTREKYVWLYEKHLSEALGPLYISAIETEHFDELKKRFDPALAASTVNLYLKLAKAPLTFARNRKWILYTPWTPREVEREKVERWYTVEQRDRFLEGVFDLAPNWYLFFYLTVRVGLRRGEVYALSHRQFDRERMRLVIDRRAIRGTKSRPARILPGRKARRGQSVLELAVSQDIFDAYDWHCKMGYAGEQLVVAQDDALAAHLDSHAPVMRKVQRKLGLPLFPHHAVGRHSVASQAVEEDVHAKTIQQQLGHHNPATTQRYIHVRSGAQLKIMESLRPARAPHEPDTRSLN
jgi:integrase